MIRPARGPPNWPGRCWRIPARDASCWSRSTCPRGSAKRCPLIKAAIPSTVELLLDLDDICRLIEADGAQMQQLIMNIIINGAEAIPEGTTGAVTITTRCEQMDERDLPVNEGTGAVELRPGSYVRIRSRRHRQRDGRSRPKRAFSTRSLPRSSPGAGWGWRRCWGSCAGHRGSMQVSSAPGEGATFRVLLPAVEAAGDPPEAVAEPAVRGPSRTRPDSGGG